MFAEVVKIRPLHGLILQQEFGNRLTVSQLAAWDVEACTASVELNAGQITALGGE